MIRPIRETPIIPSEIQINCPSRLLDTSAPITTKRAANCRAENSPDRNANNRDFFSSPFLLPAKAKIFFNVPNGNYILKINYDNYEKYLPFKKDDNWKKIIVSLQGDIFSKKQEIALNIITLTLIILNISIYTKLKKEIKKDLSIDTPLIAYDKYMSYIVYQSYNVKYDDKNTEKIINNVIDEALKERETSRGGTN